MKLVADAARGAAQGELTPAEAAAYGRIAELQIKAVELAEFEQRLTQIEERQKEEARRRAFERDR